MGKNLKSWFDAKMNDAFQPWFNPQLYIDADTIQNRVAELKYHKKGYYYYDYPEKYNNNLLKDIMKNPSEFVIFINLEEKKDKYLFIEKEYSDIPGYYKYIDHVLPLDPKDQEDYIQNLAYELWIIIINKFIQ